MHTSHSLTLAVLRSQIDVILAEPNGAAAFVAGKLEQWFEHGDMTALAKSFAHASMPSARSVLAALHDGLATVDLTELNPMLDARLRLALGAIADFRAHPETSLKDPRLLDLPFSDRRYQDPGSLEWAARAPWFEEYRQARVEPVLQKRAERLRGRELLQAWARAAPERGHVVASIRHLLGLVKELKGVDSPGTWTSRVHLPESQLRLEAALPPALVAAIEASGASVVEAALSDADGLVPWDKTAPGVLEQDVALEFMNEPDTQVWVSDAIHAAQHARKQVLAAILASRTTLAESAIEARRSPAPAPAPESVPGSVPPAEATQATEPVFADAESGEAPEFVGP